MEESLIYYKKKLSFFYYCIENNIISNEEIIHWADYEINFKDSVPFFIYDMSLARNIEEQLRIIDDVIFEFKLNNMDNLDITDVIKHIQMLYKQGKLDIFKTIEKLYPLHLITKNHNIEEDIYQLDDCKDIYFEKKKQSKI